MVLCEISAQITSIRPSFPVFSCPSGWYGFNGYCYFVSSHQMTFAMAQAYCPSLDPRAYLIKITSQDEINFITPLLSDHTWVKSFSI
jgi:hypothetical protein